VTYVSKQTSCENIRNSYSYSGEYVSQVKFKLQAGILVTAHGTEVIRISITSINIVKVIFYTLTTSR